jgi:very-short-patch-repair endonuclease
MQKNTNDYFDNMNRGANSKIRSNAYELRKNSTSAEQILWEEIRNKKIENVKFRRQHAIMKFIADFYCHEAKLIIEVDGDVHEQTEVKERDKGREFELEKAGIKIIRFTNEEIYYEMNSVLEKIREVLRERIQ